MAPRRRRRAAPKKKPARRSGSAFSKAKAEQLARTAAVVGAAGFFGISYLSKMNADAVAKGEKPKIPEALTKGYGPAALLAAIGYLLGTREKNVMKGAGIKAGAFAAAAALAVSAYNDSKAAAAGGPSALGRLLTYEPQRAGQMFQQAGAFVAAGARGRPSPDIRGHQDNVRRIVVG